MNINKLHIILALLFASVTSMAQGIKADASLDTNTILIGDQTHLVLKLRQEEGFAVQWPVINDTITKNIEVLDISEPDTVRNNGHFEITRKYLITSFDSGYFVVPPLKFIYNFKNDTTFEMAETEAMLLTVKTIKVDTTKAIKDIKEIESEPFTIGEILTYFVFPPVGLILLALLVIYIIRRRKANKPIFGPAKKPLPPPDMEALAALNELREKRLWQNNAVKEFYSGLTDIMRRYIERRFDFPAQEMVTSEIIGSLKYQDLDATLIESTEEVLSNADLVKFAKYEPLGDVNDSALKWGYRFVELTSKNENEGKEDES